MILWETVQCVLWRKLKISKHSWVPHKACSICVEEPGSKNNVGLHDSWAKNLLLPWLHTKLSHMKKFVNAVLKDELILLKAVSYTHLDVYKRQSLHWSYKKNMKTESTFFKIEAYINNNNTVFFHFTLVVSFILEPNVSPVLQRCILTGSTEIEQSFDSTLIKQ